MSRVDDFKYHAPTTDQVERMNLVRDVLVAGCVAIEKSCPDGDDRKEAINYLRKARMFANSSIVLENKKNG